MKVQDLYSYPIKSLGGRRHPVTEVHALCLLYERRWMLVDKSGKFLSPRTLPKISMLEVQINHKYRLLVKKKGPNDTFFGQNLIVEKSGYIKCSETLNILEKEWVS